MTYSSDKPQVKAAKASAEARRLAAEDRRRRGERLAHIARIREALKSGNDRPAYMVLRHAGIEPRATVDALYAAGLVPKEYNVLCRELSPEQIAIIAANARAEQDFAEYNAR